MMNEKAEMFIMYTSSYELQIYWSNLLLNVMLNNDQLLKQYTDYKKVFSEKETNQLSRHNKKNHKIKTNDSKLSFKLLYNLSVSKLQILHIYIDDNLIKDFIQLFSSLTEVSILFIKKKNEILHLCINYRTLNRVIIKNWYSLLLISKTLN